MAKKQEKASYQGDPGDEHVEKVTIKKVAPKKPTWEIKDRVYNLKQMHKPLSFSLRSSGIFYFDPEAGYERELKYCQNQRTVFVDEMKGDQRLEHVVFRNGMLIIPKEKQIYEKGNANIIPSILSSNPPCPGIRLPEFFILDNLLK